MDSVLSLAAGAIGGDAAATAELLERVWPDAFRIAWSVLGERCAAEDAAQDACALTLTKIASLRHPAAFRAWFYRVVVNEANRRRRSGSTLPIEERISFESGGAREDHIDLQRALRALDPPLRVATVLHYYLDLSGIEIATIVGATPLTVRWRLFMARRRLRSMLGEQPVSQKTLRKRTGEYADEPQAIR